MCLRLTPPGQFETDAAAAPAHALKTLAGFAFGNGRGRRFAGELACWRPFQRMEVGAQRQHAPDATVAVRARQSRLFSTLALIKGSYYMTVEYTGEFQVGRDCPGFCARVLRSLRRRSGVMLVQLLFSTVLALCCA